MFTPYLEDFISFIILIIAEFFLIKANYRIRVIDKDRGGIEKNKVNRYCDERGWFWYCTIGWAIVHIGGGLFFYYFGMTKILFLIMGFVSSNVIWDTWQSLDC